ncbi:UV-B-induced protein At3g17800, chloroplastic-like [Typha angustifolia]|uniref:UV-B-induced protein At3g17800, chloroplastic-like n=1 Tax=Typha angustifolia TaxID=59011 RepID=UPI003C2AD058
MDCCVRVKVASLSLGLVVSPRRSYLCRRSSFAKLGSLGSARLSLDFQGVYKFNQSCSFTSGRTSTLSIVASAQHDEYESRSVGTPLEPQSAEGNFLCGILKSQPHIFPFAAAEQLEELATERKSAFARWENSIGSPESSLHRRIAEMKDQECQISIQDVMYMLIVYKFTQIKVPMVPNLYKIMNNGRLEIWSSKDEDLESIHGLEVLEMVREHLSNVIRMTCKSDSKANLLMCGIKRLHLGRVYAASIMYGYFMKSVSLRHQLDLNLAQMNCQFPHLGNQEQENLVALGCSANMASSSHSRSDARVKAQKLRGYMMGFDSKTLQLCAKLRSQEATNLIENHSWALFGDHDKNTLANNEVITVTSSGLKRLVLEAVAFGSFLWDAEGHVDTIYKLKES